jgi:hypothetical protein
MKAFRKKRNDMTSRLHAGTGPECAITNVVYATTPPASAIALMHGWWRWESPGVGTTSPRESF